MSKDYILEVSWGCPSEKWPTNGLFQFDQAKALKEIGENVVFLALDVRSIKKWRKWGLNTFEKNGIPVYEFNFPYGPLSPKYKFIIQDYCFNRAISAIEKKHGKPQCIHVHTCQQALAVSEYCRLNKIPYYITEHVWPIDMGAYVNERMKTTYKAATKVIAVSNALSQVLKDYCGIDCAVVHNIVDLNSFEYAPSNKRDDGVYRFVSAAQVEYRKGMDILVKGFSEFLKSGVKSYLTIMGDGSQLENVKKLAIELGIQDYITYTGKYERKQFAEELHRSDCFVLVSRDETFGIVYVEAMACGIPAIASMCGGPSDIIDDSNGLLVPMEDPHALAEAMKKIVNIEYDSEKIARDCRQRYNSQKIAKEIKAVLYDQGNDFGE
ncbi:Glycosyltransferase involved in cell wall bisynthesis [Butyrivibrio hungatei DSM 14810]|uniref:Glycosyltransferase involved in cell wall bisynthesis n=1 Tax=Butyrivibrio hungatei DSM 14810 TaxID=1121132 RepID=A0A1M7T4W6_9FIRM|nr:glycosyltransferase [Butyrivibrio hungatei]SHN65790.1 Glycosyltransferase involved in cell wall bisynthesis [Butyrivibrio hungatei DSM 14810]